MADHVETFHGLIADLRIGISLCTRLPLGSPPSLDDSGVARASWTFPVAGILVGLAGALAYWLAIRLNVAPIPAAALALAVTMAFTGAMHEDGLADSFDGIGGNSRERKLEIMRDSRIGTFGTLALVVTLLLRWSTLADIAEPRYVAIALVSAHASARAAMTAFMHLVPPARSDGLSTDAGRPPGQSVAAALAIGIFALLFGFGAKGAMISLLLLAFAGIIAARIALRQIGGQTGDVLGAFEQVSEAVVLLIAASLF
jgi:adenosylcobinamide-GDP ribazoletransferase